MYLLALSRTFVSIRSTDTGVSTPEPSDTSGRRPVGCWFDGITVQAQLRRQRKRIEQEPPISGKRHRACCYFFATLRIGNASSNAA
jgi:hypothetical protein